MDMLVFFIFDAWSLFHARKKLLQVARCRPRFAVEAHYAVALHVDDALNCFKFFHGILRAGAVG